MDDTLPAGFFTDILRTSFGEEEAARQLDVAVNWGRYAELYDYDATRGQIIREEQGIGATIADAPQPASRGSLTVYLGAAPGSGKTFTMLREGRALRAQGEDVVIGFADTRGRPHTVEAIGGLETVPPRLTQPSAPDGPGRAAVLARKPAVALVDDLGLHAARDRGAAQRRHPRDQHRGRGRRAAGRASEVEADDRQRRAAATITDAVLAASDALQFVDSSPEALRKRLGHGNIYPADQIEARAARPSSSRPGSPRCARSGCGWSPPVGRAGRRVAGHRTPARPAGRARRGLAARPGGAAGAAGRAAGPPPRRALLRARAQPAEARVRSRSPRR